MPRSELCFISIDSEIIFLVSLGGWQLYLIRLDLNNNAFSSDSISTV